MPAIPHPACTACGRRRQGCWRDIRKNLCSRTALLAAVTENGWKGVRPIEEMVMPIGVDGWRLRVKSEVEIAMDQ